MKSILKIFALLLFVSLSLILSGQWEIVNDGRYVSAGAVDFIDGETGWASTDGLYKTIDGGRSWTLLDNVRSFNRIDFYSNNLGWALNDQGTLKTDDGGRTWKLVQSPYDVICATSSDTAYIFRNEFLWREDKNTTDIRVLRTSDGGSSWTDISPNNYQYDFSISSAAFINLKGVVEGYYLENGNECGMILETPDGGETWHYVKVRAYSNIYNVKILNDTTACFLAKGKTNNKYYLCRTTDWFDSWSVVFENNNPILAFHFFDNNNFVTLMEENGEGKIMKSNNGGYTWRKAADKLPVSEIMNHKIFSGTGNTGILVISTVNISVAGRNGSMSLILRTTDRGETWDCVRFNLSSLNDIGFASRNTGIVLGGFGTHNGLCFGYVFQTVNGDNSWQLVLSTPGVPQSCTFADRSVGFISSSAMLYQTVDGGLSWTENSWDPGETSGPVSLDFVSEYMGFLAFGKKIYKTSDRGKIWNLWLEHSGCPGTGCISYLNSVSFIDAYTGWALWENGEIFRITGNEWEQISSWPNYPLKKIFFADRNSGWIAGGYSSNNDFHPRFLRTVDGGVSWTEPENNRQYLIHDMYFSTALYGWAVGEDRNRKGYLLETDNGGISWNPVVEDLPFRLTAINFKEGIGWAVGDNGLMLRNESVEFIDTGELRNTGSGKESELECSPNPFRSETVVSFKSLVAGYIEINIYDFMGRKVSTVVHEKMPEGNHEVTWNAENLTPGIYFCELRVSNSNMVQKIILLN